MRTILDFIPAGRMKLAARGQDGPEYHGPCPSCGGRDRFIVWPEHRKAGGKFYCRQCGASGDGIAFLMDFEGMAFQDAKAALGGQGVNSAKQGKATRPTGKQPGAEQAAGWAKTAKLAKLMYEASNECSGHAYLTMKSVRPCRGLRALSQEAIRLYAGAMGKDAAALTGGKLAGLKLGGKTFQVGDLAVPLCLSDGSLSTLQLINQDQTENKRTLPNSKKQDSFFVIPAKEGHGDDAPLLLAEGLATALSINQATGYKVVMSVDAGNLLPVAQFMRQRWPNREIIVCGDNDPNGRAKAEEAAAVIGAVLYIPSEIRREE